VARLRRRVDRAAELTALAEVLVAMGLELRAGVLPDRALIVAVGASPEPSLRRAVAQARCAEDPRPSLLRSSEPIVRAVGAAWGVSSTTGAPLALSVARLAAAARGEAEAVRALQAALAGPRSSARILAGLPLLGLAMGQGMGASPVQVLLTSAPGLACLIAGAGFATAGLVWTDRLVRGAQRRCSGAG
jgi:tight adherence protein B